MLYLLNLTMQITILILIINKSIDRHNSKLKQLNIWIG